MLKYSLSIFMGLMLVAAASNSYSVPPPEYLKIKDFKKCLDTQNFGTWKGWCMPAEKPESCPAESWEQLKALTEKEKLHNCPAK
jgi:hypothetical protein